MWFVVIVFCLIVAVLAYQDAKKPKNYPPGPIWLPYLGSILPILKGRKETGYLVETCVNMTKKYSKGTGVLGLRLGRDRVVVAGNPESIKEMLLNEELDGRPLGPIVEWRTWNQRLGLLFTDEQVWTDHRKFIVKYLKEFGFGNRAMEEMVETEAEQMVLDTKKLINEGNGIAEMQNYFDLYVLNTIWRMMAGKRYPKEDPRINRLQNLLFDLFLNIDMIGALFSHFPILRYLAPNLSGYNKYMYCYTQILDFLQEEVDNHKKLFREENEDRDVMDVYIRMMKTENRDHFHEKQLLALCLDMFMAGSETTSKTMGFAFFNLIKHQDIQDKVRAEIDAVIGRNRLPNLEDRPNLPYSEAVMMESIRHFAGRSFGLPHRALRNSKLAGFDIPKDTMVIENIYGILFDEKRFPNPLEFNPERFLKNGKTKIFDAYIPFGIGRHRCIGEKLAKSNVFLFTVTMVQNFIFKLPEGHPPLNDNGVDGFTPSVESYRGLIFPRSN